jgi:apolipoprotein N-acyltransferase
MIAVILLDASRKVAAAVVAGSMLCLNLGIGIVCLSIPTDTSSQLRVAAIQGNVSTSEKWTDESRGHTERIYRKLSLQAAADGADVIVWPETALPYNLDRDYDMRMYLVQLARECDATLLVSLFTEDGVSGKLYNSVVSIDSSGNISETEYHKINLVPFGEFVPLHDLVMTVFPPLAELGMLDGDLLFGEGAQVFDTEEGRISSLICFDSIYEDNSLESVCMGAQLLAVSTNDSWFSDSAAVYMHNSQSRLRAIETGRYVVRSANTGVSSIISSKGEVLEILPPLVDGYVISDVYLSDAKTPYLQIGNLFVYMCIGFVGAVLLCSPLERIISGLRRKHS